MMSSLHDDVIRVGNKLRDMRTGFINKNKPRLPSQNTDMNFILSDLIVQQIQNKNVGRSNNKNHLEKGGLETARPLRSRSKLENEIENHMEGRSTHQLDNDLMDITVRSNIYSSLHELSDRIDNGTPMSILKTLGETPHALQNQKYDELSSTGNKLSPLNNNTEISRYGQERELKK